MQPQQHAGQEQLCPLLEVLWIEEKKRVICILTASYRTTDVGFVKAIVDAPCPTEVGDNNWVDYTGFAFSPPGILVGQCPENKGVEEASSPFSKLS